MKFCTTCGRTYEDPEIDICPHDGTPLFGMAGSEGKDLPDEDVEAEEGGGEIEASATEEVVELPGVVPAVAEVEPEQEQEDEEEDLVDLPAPVATSVAPVLDESSEEEDEEDDLFVPPSEPLFEESEPREEEREDDLFGGDDEEEEDVDLPVSVASTRSDELPAEDPLAASERALFGSDDEETSLLSDDSEATPDTAPVLSDELFAEDREREFDIPGADDAASIQISEALDTTLEDLSEDSEPEGDVSLADAYQPTSIPQEEEVAADRMPDPLQDDSSGGRTGLLLVLLLLILAAGAAWYFLAGPGATPETPATPPPVEKKDPAAQKEEPTTPTPAVAVTPDAGSGADAGAQADMGAATQADAGAAAPESDTSRREGGTEAKTGASNEGIAPPPVKEDPVPVKKVTTPKKTTTTTTKKEEPAKKEAPAEEPAKKEELNNELENLLE